MKPNTLIDQRNFRHALGKFATGVTIITAKDVEQGYVGTTASSFNSVSMDPPLILWSIAKSARALAAYQQAEHFCVNVLAEDQISLSNHFARQQENKFNKIAYQLSEEGIPVLDGCSTNLQCQTKYIYEGGDHLIIVGEVKAFDTSSQRGLVFHQGGYAVTEDISKIETCA